MARRHLIPLFAALAAGCGGGATSAESELVGGELVPEGQFPSTVKIQGSCTASRVGPRHILLAAHCVDDADGQELNSRFRPGARLWISGHHQLDDTIDPEVAGYERVEVARVHVPEAWWEAMGSASVKVLLPEAPPDVAVVELTAEAEITLAQLPIATVDLAPIEVGAPLVIMGYGCEHGLDGDKDYAQVRLKAQATHAVHPVEIDHEGTYAAVSHDHYRERLVRSYLFTPGAFDDPTQASLCPGDSGGPVYRGDGQQNRISGVNSYYTFAESGDPDGVSVTNWHTRIDGDSRFDIGSWLQTVGVRVTGAPSHLERFVDCLTLVDGSQVCAPFADYYQSPDGAAELGLPDGSARFEPCADGVWRWAQLFESGRLEHHPELGEDDVVRVAAGQLAPCAATIGDDDWYCGHALDGGHPERRYHCIEGVAMEDEPCEYGCEVDGLGSHQCAPPPGPDPCAAAPAGDGTYCGSSLGAPDPTSIYHCEDGGTFSMTHCPGACIVGPADTPDSCG